MAKKSGSSDRYRIARVVGLDYNTPVKARDDGTQKPGEELVPDLDADLATISRVLVDFDPFRKDHTGIPPTSVFRGDVHKITRQV
jgi:hypothetical protein